MANFFSWIGMREERQMLVQVRDHVNKVREVVGLLKEALEAASRGASDEVAQIHQRLSDSEREADEIRRKLLSALTEGLLLPPDRDNLVQLIERIDHVADAAHGASRVLALFDGYVPEKAVMDALIEMSDVLIKAVDGLGEAMVSLYKGAAKETLEKCTEVEEYEEDCDRRKADLLRLIFNLDLSASRLLLLHDLIGCMEDTADKAEDSCDVIRNLAVKLKR